MDDDRRTGDMSAGKERPLMPGEEIYDLVDVVREADVNQKRNGDPGDETVKIHDLVDVVNEDRESQIITDEFHNEMMHRISRIAEKVAREMFPDIAERIIREEIEKLKKDI
ncbi:MAG: hypothetical protein JXA41_09665 [Deltaproteobacteria bacterium]|nr:hypothetical protein [Deltaproteobacteria bacterium]